MACTVLDRQAARNAINNRTEFFRILQPNQVTQKELVERLDAITQNIELAEDEKGESFYAYAGTKEQAVKTRVSEYVRQKLNRARYNTKTETGEIKADAGTYVHKAMQLIIDDIFSNNGKGLPKIEREFLKGFGSDFRSSKSVFTSLKKLGQSIVDEINTKQAEINKRNGTKEKAVIRTEQVLVDPTEDRGGTADVMVVFSDATMGNYDFKTSEHDGDLNGNLISWSKFEGYQIQMNEYARIAREQLQAKGIVASRVVPIQLNLKNDKQKGKAPKYYRNITAAIHSKEGTIQMPTTAERTMTRELDDMLRSQGNIIKEYQERIRKTKEPSKRAALHSKLDAVYSVVQNLLVSGQIGDVVKAIKIIQDDFDSRKSILPDQEDYLTDEDLNNMFNEIQSYKNIPDYLNSYFNIISNDKGKTYSKEFIESIKKLANSNLGGAITRIEGELIEIIASRIAAELPERYVTRDATGRVFIDDAPMIGTLTAMFNKLSQIQHPAFAYLYEKVRKKHMQIDDGVKNDADKMLEAERKFLEWANSNGLSENEAYKQIINTTTKSRHMYSQYDEKFFGDEGARAKAHLNKDVKFFKTYYELAPDFKERVAAMRKQEIARLRGKYYYFKPQEFEGKTRTEEELRAEYSKELKRWDNRHDPGKDAFWTSKFNINNRLLILNKEAAAPFETAQYKKIQSTPGLRDMYNTVVELNEKYRDMLGMGYYDLPNNFLSFVRMDMLEGMNRHRNVKDLLQFTAQSFKATFNVREDDTFMGARNIIDGGLNRSIPIFYMNPVKNARGEIDNENLKSMDIVRSTILFSQMAHNHYHMSNIEYEIKNMQALLGSMTPAGISHQFNTKSGSAAFDHMADKALVKLGLKGEEYALFGKFVNYYLYGIRFEEMEKMQDVEFGPVKFNPVKTLFQLKQFHTKVTLALPLITAVAAGTAVRGALEVEAARNILFNKKQLKTSTKRLGTHFKEMRSVAHFFNIYGRQVSADKIQESLGQKGSKLRKYGSTEGLLRPLSFVDEGADIVGVDVMLDNYRVNLELKQLERIRNKEKVKPNETLRAQLKMTKQKNGKYEVDFRDDLGLSEDEKINIRTQYQAAILELSQRTKGTPHAHNVSQTDLNIGLSLLMHYKSWMPGLLRARFAGTRYDDATMTLEMGRYRAAFDELKLTPQEKKDAGLFMGYVSSMLKEATELGLDIVTFGKAGMYTKPNKERARILYGQFIKQHPHLADKISFEEFVELKESQLKGFVKELQVLLLFMLGGFMIGKVAPGDDGEEDKAAAEAMGDQGVIVAKRILNKSYTELVFALNPFEYLRLVQNPLPVASLIITALKSITNGLDEVAQDVGLKDENRYDRTPYWYFFSQLFPGMIQMRNVVPFFEEDEMIRNPILVD